MAVCEKCLFDQNWPKSLGHTRRDICKTDLKQLPGLKKTKMLMYSISSKLKSAFSTIGKTTADKLTSKLAGKSLRFRFCVNN